MIKAVFIDVDDTLLDFDACARQTIEAVRQARGIAPIDYDTFRRMNLSARAYQRLRKVARTIADLDGSADIQEKHLGEAIRYRSLSILGESDL